MPLDMWIEVTTNLCSTLKANWLRLLQNEKQFFVTARNANNVSTISNSKNIIPLQKLIKNHLIQEQRNRQINYSMGKVCTDISTNSTTQLPQFVLDHTEADYMMLTIYSIVRHKSPDLPVIIISEDTDV